MATRARRRFGGVVLDEDGNRLATISHAIGHGTNNEAEYRGAIAVVEAAIALGARSVELRMDSELIVRQFSGRYRVRNPALIRHFQRLDILRRQLDRLELVHVPREQQPRSGPSGKPRPGPPHSRLGFR